MNQKRFFLPTIVFFAIGTAMCIGVLNFHSVKYAGLNLEKASVAQHLNVDSGEDSYSPTVKDIQLNASLSTNEAVDTAAVAEEPTTAPETNAPNTSAQIPPETISIHQLEDLSHKNDKITLEPSLRSYTPGQTIAAMNPTSYVPPVNTNLNKNVFGFAPYWNFALYTQQYQWDKLSTIGFFSLTCGDSGEWYYDDAGWNTWNSATMDSVIATAHANGVKVVPVVKNFDRYSIRRLVDYYDECDTDPVNCPRQFLIRRILDQVNNKNVDGVNVDFEYFGSQTYPVDDKLRADFVSFMDELADRVHAARPGSQVSIDSIASAGNWYTAYDVAGFGASSVDYVLVMAYDFYTTNSAMGAPVSPLYGGQYWYTVSASMNDIAAQMPRAKILMGIPYYGLEYQVDPWEWPEKNATVVGSAYTTTYRVVTDPVYDEWHNAGTIHYDSGEKMTWYAYGWPDVTWGPDYWEGYYDDPTSLSAKYDFVNANSLGGIGIWALGYDYGRTELWDTIFNKFSMSDFVVIFKPGTTQAQRNALYSLFGVTVTNANPNNDNMVYVKPISRLSVDVIRDFKARREVLGAFFPNSGQNELF